MHGTRKIDPTAMATSGLVLSFGSDNRRAEQAASVHSNDANCIINPDIQQASQNLTVLTILRNYHHDIQSS